jgi:hypothetical protein
MKDILAAVFADAGLLIFLGSGLYCIVLYFRIRSFPNAYALWTERLYPRCLLISWVGLLLIVTALGLAI